jgi:hypothetical protein
VTTWKLEPPYYPIVYVRGYAGNENEIEDAIADPYMGFNLGSTRIRTLYIGPIQRYYFESPLVRLMKDFEYRDVYSAGLNVPEAETSIPDSIEPRSIVIYRYYDLVSRDFGRGEQVKMEEFSEGLSRLILRLREQVCGAGIDKAQFKVYLVGHSMGGLVIRCFPAKRPRRLGRSKGTGRQGIHLCHPAQWDRIGDSGECAVVFHA